MNTDTMTETANGHTLTPANIFAGRCRLKRLVAPEQLAALQAVARADAHQVLMPTHVVCRGDEIIGYGSLGALPTLHVWMDSRKAHASDSLRMLETAETLLENTGAKFVLMPCAVESPFTPHMERLGYTKLGPTVLWIKQL